MNEKMNVQKIVSVRISRANQSTVYQQEKPEKRGSLIILSNPNKKRPASSGKIDTISIFPPKNSAKPSQTCWQFSIRRIDTWNGNKPKGGQGRIGITRENAGTRMANICGKFDSVFNPRFFSLSPFPLPLHNVSPSRMRLKKKKKNAQVYQRQVIREDRNRGISIISIIIMKR